MNKRIVSIIYELYHTNSENSISSLAEKFKVSQRTIRNDLNVINDFLRENQVRRGKAEKRRKDFLRGEF